MGAVELRNGVSSQAASVSILQPPTVFLLALLIATIRSKQPYCVFLVVLLILVVILIAKIHCALISLALHTQAL